MKSAIFTSSTFHCIHSSYVYYSGDGRLSRGKPHLATLFLNVLFVVVEQVVGAGRRQTPGEEVIPGGGVGVRLCLRAVLLERGLSRGVVERRLSRGLSLRGVLHKGQFKAAADFLGWQLATKLLEKSSHF